MSVQHMSSKGKAKATNPDSDFQKLASVSPDPCAGRLTSVEDPTCRNRTVSRVRDREPSQQRLDPIFGSMKERKIRRRKRWRPQDSHPQPAELVGGPFYHRYLSGPRLPPRTPTVTEVIVPEYAKETVASRLGDAGSTALAAEDNVEPKNGRSIVGHGTPRFSKHFSRIRQPWSPRTPPTVSVPLPITHGYGDFEQRVDRCRQVIQQKDRNTQGVLEGLSGKSGEDWDDDAQTEVYKRAASGNVPQAGSKTHPPTLASQARVSRDLQLNTSVRRYSTPADTVRQRHRPGDDFPRKPTNDLFLRLSSMLNESAAKGMKLTSNTPRIDSRSIDGFCENWKDEEWKGDEWKDAWGDNAPVLEKPSMTSSIDLGDWLKGLRAKKRCTPPLDKVVDIHSRTNRILPSIFHPVPANLKIEVFRNSRRGLKAVMAAIKRKAKHEFLSKLAVKSPLQDRKTVKAERKLKKLAALKDVVSGSLKPLAPGEQVLVDIPAPNVQRPVSRLAHGLDRALFSQSVQWLQDPHSRVFNFPPNLQHLPSVTDFAFERLPKYIKSSKDEDLHNLALRHSKQFSGSTSSLTNFLTHIYFLVSGDRRVDISTLSMAFIKEPRNFTPGLRSPATFTLHHRRHTLGVNKEAVEGYVNQLTNTPCNPWEAVSGELSSDSTNPSNPDESQTMKTSNVAENHLSLSPVMPSGVDRGIEYPHPVVGVGSSSPHNIKLENGYYSDDVVASDPLTGTYQYFDTYAIDAGGDSLYGRREAEQNLLLWLGTMTEKFLTLSEEEFSCLLRKNTSAEKIPEEKKEAYRYSKSSNFVMRSQLDCQDSRLPGTGIFDIKTRAVLPIRIDRLNFQANSGYLIRKMTGQLESFEREYYDLIRGAFLKYNFQARIGAMDGVFIAYHNTARMFGFQYVPVTEMEQRLYGPGPPERGDRVFEKCVGLMEVLVAQIVSCFPGQSVSCTVDARDGSKNLMLWVIPLENPRESRPIAEFIVTVSHFIDGHPVSSQTAIDRAHANWVLNYKVTRSRRPASKILKALKATQIRRFKHILPEGVSEEEMVARLSNVDWGAGLGLDLQPEEPSVAPDGPAPSEPGTSKFSNANKYLKQLRQLALAGKEDTKREEATAAPPIVWGRDPDIVVHSDPLLREATGSNLTAPQENAATFSVDELSRVFPTLPVDTPKDSNKIALHTIAKQLPTILEQRKKFDKIRDAFAKYHL